MVQYLARPFLNFHLKSHYANPTHFLVIMINKGIKDGVYIINHNRMLITITILKSCNHFSLHFLKNLSKFFKHFSTFLHQISINLHDSFGIHSPQGLSYNCFGELVEEPSRISTVQSKVINGILRFLSIGAILS